MGVFSAAPGHEEGQKSAVRLEVPAHDMIVYESEGSMPQQLRRSVSLLREYFREARYPDKDITVSIRNGEVVRTIVGQFDPATDVLPADLAYVMAGLAAEPSPEEEGTQERDEDRAPVRK